MRKLDLFYQKFLRNGRAVLFFKQHSPILSPPNGRQKGHQFKPILNKLDQERKQISQSFASFAQNLQRQIQEVENKLSKILDIHLDGLLTLEEYQHKKEQLINQKTELKQKLREKTFLSKIGSNWQLKSKKSGI